MSFGKNGHEDLFDRVVLADYCFAQFVRMWATVVGV
jgi:hypothetical protein